MTVQLCKIFLTRKKTPKDLSKISALDFILFVVFYEQITKYTSFTNWKYLQFLYNKALLRFWFMAFLEHSVFQNKDIGFVFSTLFIYTLDVKGKLFWKRSLHSLLIWSTGKTEAGCIQNVRRGTVQMCCCTMPWSEAIVLHQMLLSGEEKKIPLSHSSSAFSFE